MLSRRIPGSGSRTALRRRRRPRDARVADDRRGFERQLAGGRRGQRKRRSDPAVHDDGCQLARGGDFEILARLVRLWRGLGIDVVSSHQALGKPLVHGRFRASKQCVQR